MGQVKSFFLLGVRLRTYPTSVTSSASSHFPQIQTKEVWTCHILSGLGREEPRYPVLPRLAFLRFRPCERSGHFLQGLVDGLFLSQALPAIPQSFLVLDGELVLLT